MRRAAFTLPEVLVAAALTALFMSVLYSMWSGMSRQSASVDARLTSLKQAQVALFPLVSDLRTARRLLYPAPGDAQAGVAVIGGDGKPFAVVFERGAGEGPGRLVRHDGANSQGSVLLEGVQSFSCQVAAVPGERAPDLVHLLVTVVDATGRTELLATSAHLRALDTLCPIGR